ncbi:energy transducer TonB [Prevotella pectinovora]|uniref:Energy transducer TonB n=1 Tax=Prevotella pectinovora TaxID=1602169 RepID=A0A0D0IR23_9BACT|nr:energy transducer TonB [Prevotella pectinovora]KIP54560.1 energy transducer TonB [Prevotella pectinovora]KIP56849.1 energy transducer TonB [Prevotella pectinovora]KIP60071.1 energy transducer TonB [Prevotella pectinovora]KIP61153.1 energy transducer TonB [Prevotella pectinovora]KIP63477.1 energy transducer TonB [Prevotella pectinovora]
MAKIDLISNEWADIVFQGRNKVYGAYQLRRGTSKRNIVSMIFVAAVAAVAYLGLAAYNSYQEAQKAKFEAEMEASLLEAKKEAKVEKKTETPKVEQVQKVEKVKSSIAFTPPVIKKDSEVKPEEEMKTQDELKETKTAIGAFDVKGNDEAGGTVLKAVEDIAAPEPPKHEEEQNKIFEVVEQQPQFPGGSVNGWLADHIKYPVVAAENGISGRVVVQFVVERDGSVSQVKVVRGVDPSLDKEAQRVISSMPKWIPGKQNGQAVRSRFTVPVTFRLQ